jgi:MFS transporter, CP family, cyanate transporter
VIVIAAIVYWFAPPTPVAAPTAAMRRRWMPDFRNPLIWRIGLLLGSVNASYFALNGFLPDYLTHTGRPDLINAALTALNAGQLPASFLLLVSADRMVRTMWSYLGCGVVALMCVLAIMAGGQWVVIGAAIWGCCGAAVLILVLALPPLISAPDDVHRVSAGMFTISYSCAVVVPIVSGALWDMTGWVLAPFVPILVCMLVVIGLAPTIVLRDKSA